jgi:hypothetical protein
VKQQREAARSYLKLCWVGKRRRMNFVASRRHLRHSSFERRIFSVEYDPTPRAYCRGREGGAPRGTESRRPGWWTRRRRTMSSMPKGAQYRNEAEGPAGAA